MSAKPTAPTAPVMPVYNLQVLQAQNPMGTASYTLNEYLNGSVIATVTSAGGWDDATPWSGDYPLGNEISHGGSPAWFVAGGSPTAGRSGVLFHTDYTPSQANSMNSIGCAVVNASFLNTLAQTVSDAQNGAARYNLQASAYNYENNAHLPWAPVAPPLNLDDTNYIIPPELNLKAMKDTAGATDFVKLTISITHAVSKDIWVFVKVTDPDKWVISQSNIKQDVLVLNNAGTAKQSSKAINNGVSNGSSVNLGANAGSADTSIYSAYQVTINNFDQNHPGIKNGSDSGKKGFWIRIAAGATSEEVDVKPAYDTTNTASRTESFQIGDYGVVYGVSDILYKDGNTQDSSDVLTGGNPTEANVDVTITPQSYTAYAEDQQFGKINNQLVHENFWEVGVDPDKSHTITVQANYPLQKGFTLQVRVQQLSGSWTSISCPIVSTSSVSWTFSIPQSALKDTEGQLQILPPKQSPNTFAAYKFIIDNKGSSSIFSNASSGPSAISSENFASAPETSAWNANSFTTGTNGDTLTDNNGATIFQSTINADGTTTVWTYAVAGQPFVSMERIYDVNGNVSSTSLYDSSGAVYLSGTGTLNGDGTTTVVLFNPNGQIDGQEIDQAQSATGLGGPVALTLYQNPGSAETASVNNYNDTGGLTSATFYDTSGATTKTETVTTNNNTLVYDYYNTSNVLVEQRVTGIAGQAFTSSDTTYDPSSGNALSVTEYEVAGAIYESGVYTYDDGLTTLTLRNASGTVEEIDAANADGSKTVSLLNVIGEPYASGVSDYNASGQMTSQTLSYASGATYQTTVLNTDDDVTTILTYDHSGTLTTKEIDNNGTRAVTTYGITGQAYSSDEFVYSGSNIQSETFTDTNGNSEVKSFSYYGNGPVETQDAIYNAGGNLIQQTTFDSSGTVSQIETLTYNADGSTTDVFSNASGFVTEKEILLVNGSTDTTIYAPPGGATISTETFADADDNIEKKIVVNADNSSLVTQHEIQGQSYSTELSTLNPSGQVTAETFLDPFDDVVATAALTQASDGSTTTITKNQYGFETQKIVSYANGDEDTTNYGFAGVADIESTIDVNAVTELTTEIDYNTDGSIDDALSNQINSDGSKTVNTYNGNGVLTKSTTTDADGSSVVTAYTLETGGSAKSTSNYNGAGALTDETLYNADGSLQEKIAVVVNASGSTTTTTTGGAGAVTSLQITNKDGSGSLAVYGINSADDDFNSTLTTYGPAGALVSETFFNNDGTKDVFTQLTNSAYSDSHAHYSASGALVVEYLQDAKGDDVLTGTPAANLNGSTTVNFDDANGVLQISQTTNTDGTSSWTTFNVTDEPYTSFTSDYDKDDDVVSQTFFNANTLYETVDYSISDDDTIAKTYDGSGTLIEKVAVSTNISNGDDTIVTTDTKYANNVVEDVKTVTSVTTSDDDVTTSTDATYNASGTLTEINTVNADGSTDVAIYGLTSGAYVSTDKQYNVDGDLVSETGTYANGAKSIYAFGITGHDYAGTEIQYDASGTPIEKLLLDANGSVLLSGAAVVTEDDNYSVSYENANGVVVQSEVDSSFGSGSEAFNSLTETVYGITGEPYSYTQTSYLTIGNANNETISETLYYANGDAYEYKSVSAPVDGIVTTETFNSSDVEISKVQQNPDGSSVITTFSPTGAYEALDTSYSAAGQITQTVQANNDSTLTKTIYGITAKPYTEIVAQFTADDQLTSETLMTGDDTVYETAVATYDDVTNAQTLTFKDASGNLASTQTTDTQGGSDIQTFGITGQPYASCDSKYNGAGNLISQVFTTSNGGLYGSESYAYDSSDELISAASYDADDSLTQIVDYNGGATTTYDYNPAGAVTQTTVLNSDGSKAVQNFGITGESYVSARDDYTSGGTLTQQTFYNADGSSSVMDENIAGESYGKTTSTYNADDQILSTTYKTSAGLVYQETNFTYNANGSANFTMTNADDQIVETWVTNADGSAVDTHLNVIGQPYTSEVTTFDNSGKASKSVFYASDDSVYETRSYTYGAGDDETVSVVNGSGATVATQQTTAAGSSQAYYTDDAIDSLTQNYGTLTATAGTNEILSGDGSAETYVYASADGNDAILDSASNISSVEMSDIKSTGVTFSNDSNDDLILTVTATGKTLTIGNQFSKTTAGAIASITFSDGVTYTDAQLGALVNNHVDPGPSVKNGTVTLGNGETEDLTDLIDSLVTAGVVGDAETITAVSASHGTIALNSGDVSYTAPGNGDDTIDFTITDQLGNKANASVAVTVDPGPTIAIGSLTVTTGQTETITSVLNGLVTPGIAGDTETLVSVSATNGTATLTNGVATYQAPSAAGGDAIAFTYEDQYGDKTTGDVTVNVSAPNLTVAEALALKNPSSSITIADTAAHVSANIDALKELNYVSSIRLTDTGTPTLSLSVAQTLDDTQVLGDIANTNYAIVISDTAANVGANIDRLNSNSKINAIVLTENGTPTLTLTASQAFGDTQALSEITTPYKLVILETLAGLTQLSKAQLAIAKAKGYAFEVQDTAANIKKYGVPELGILESLGVTELTATDTGMTFSEAQASKIISHGMALSAPKGKAISVKDNHTNIQSLSVAKINSLAAARFTHLTSTNGSVNLNVSKVIAIQNNGMTISASGGDVELKDTSKKLESLTAAEIGDLKTAGIQEIACVDSRLTLNAAQADALTASGVKFTEAANTRVTIKDTSSAIAAMNWNQMAALSKIGVKAIVATESGVTLNVAQMVRLKAEGLTIQPPKDQTNSLLDWVKPIESLTPNQIASFAKLDITSIVPMGGSVTFDVAQAIALENMKVTISSQNTLSDKAAAIEAMSSSEIKKLATLGIVSVTDTKGKLVLTARTALAFTQAGIALSMPNDASVSIKDTAAHIEAMTADQLAAMRGLGITNLKAIDAGIEINVAKALAASEEKEHLSASSRHIVEVVDRATALAALTPDEIAALGSAGVQEIFAKNSTVLFSDAQSAAILASAMTISASSGQKASEQFANGGYAVYQSNGLVANKTVNADGSYEIGQFEVTEESYFSDETLYTIDGKKLASERQNTNGSGTLTVGADHETITVQSSGVTITAVDDTLSTRLYSAETIQASGSSGDTFIFAPGTNGANRAWHDIVSGFIASGTGHETMELQTSSFGTGLTSENQNADMQAMLKLMTENAVGDAVIKDVHGDTITLTGVNKNTLSQEVNKGDFKFT